MPEPISIQRESSSQAIQRTTHDRNSDLHKGYSAELLPYSGRGWDGVFFPSVKFREPSGDGRGERGVLQRGEGHERPTTERNRRGGDPAQGSVDGWERYAETPKFSWWLPAILAAACVYGIYLAVTR